MSLLKTILHCLFSPKLNKVYGGPIEQIYEPSYMEKWGDQILLLINIMWNVGIYTSPFIVGIMYRKGYIINENIPVLSKFLTTVGVLYVSSLCIRGIGRANNDIYKKFMKALQNANKEMNEENKKVLSKYDFDFSAWPVEFEWRKLHNTIHKRQICSDNSTSEYMLQRFMVIPYKIIGTLAVRTFGLRIIYPGSLSLLQSMLSIALLQGRAKLVTENKGQRFKLKARDNNEIDVMFVDQRHKKTNNSNILVVCCEGNAGFYEIGIMSTPINAGYSVIGFNHPGFAYSTGKPYPEQEQNAIEIVMEFAVNMLDFNIDEIILFGWSIGGYVSTWAAMNYPDVKGVILDASFDDILPLAVQHMPSWWESIVKVAIRDHVNLNNFEQLKQYPGPVLFVRRTEDEVICTTENDISTNRGNYMLLKLMIYRFPFIFEKEQQEIVQEYLSLNTYNRGTIPPKFNFDQKLCKHLLESYVSQHNMSYPMDIGDDFSSEFKNQIALFLVQKHLKDYRSTHCTPLPVNMFSMPWNINVENDYVFT